MAKTNTELLRKKIDESGLKLGHIAKQCGLTYQGFANKLYGGREFRQNEIYQIQELLKLSNDEMMAIFFASEVDE